MFSFGGDGSLTLDGHLLSQSPYQCGDNQFEILWYEVSMDRVYAASFSVDGAFNEVNLNAGDGTFLGQFRDENGDFDGVNGLGGSASSDTSSDDGATVGTDSGLNGDFTLSITGTVTTVTFGIETAVTIPTVTITNILAPDANDDFEVLIEDTGFDVTGAVEVTVINNTTDRVTFGLVFEGTTDGIDATFDLVYDYQR